MTRTPVGVEPARRGAPRAPAQSPVPAELEQYYSWYRPELLALVPADVRRVLSVGCGGGVTEAELVQRGVEVFGIELNRAAACAARQRGLNVFEGDVCDLRCQLAGLWVDCLIYADVLEHVRDPESVLQAHVPLLRPGGVVIVSVPNFRHYSVFVDLFVRGRVRYRSAGIFDWTHVRITTRRMVAGWLTDAGIVMTGCRYVLPRRRDRLVSVCTLQLAREFIARQVIVVGKKPS